MKLMQLKIVLTATRDLTDDQLDELCNGDLGDLADMLQSAVRNLLADRDLADLVRVEVTD